MRTIDGSLPGAASWRSALLIFNWPNIPENPTWTAWVNNYQDISSWNNQSGRFGPNADSVSLAVITSLQRICHVVWGNATVDCGYFLLNHCRADCGIGKKKECEASKGTQELWHRRRHPPVMHILWGKTPRVCVALQLTDVSAKCATSALISPKTNTAGTFAPTSPHTMSWSCFIW